MSKSKCHRCNAEFQIPEETISTVAGFYCKACIKKAAKKYVKLSPGEVISVTGKSIGL